MEVSLIWIQLRAHTSIPYKDVSLIWIQLRAHTSIPYKDVSLIWIQLRAHTSIPYEDTKSRTHKHTRIMLHSRIGLQKFLTPNAPDGSKRVRVTPVAEPKRDDGMWKHVKVLRDVSGFLHCDVTLLR